MIIEGWARKFRTISYAICNPVDKATGYSPAFLNFGLTVPFLGRYYWKEMNPKEFTLENGESLVENMNEVSQLYQQV
ncbi:hypothetical protein ILUMI_17274, partial [Ignelater luminosus]